jgi:hypothetical protein
MFSELRSASLVRARLNLTTERSQALQQRTQAGVYVAHCEVRTALHRPDRGGLQNRIAKHGQHLTCLLAPRGRCCSARLHGVTGLIRVSAAFAAPGRFLGKIFHFRIHCY